MKSLLEYIFENILENPQDVVIVEDHEEGIMRFNVTVPEEEYPKVIGRQGRTVKGITEILKLYDAKNSDEHHRVYINISSTADEPRPMRGSTAQDAPSSDTTEDTSSMNDENEEDAFTNLDTDTPVMTESEEGMMDSDIDTDDHTSNVVDTDSDDDDKDEDDDGFRIF